MFKFPISCDFNVVFKLFVSIKKPSVSCFPVLGFVSNKVLLFVPAKSPKLSSPFFGGFPTVN